IGEGGGGAGWSLGTSFGRYVGGLRKVGLDVAIVIDSTGSMQNVIDDLKRRMDDLAATMQRLVPTARVGAVTYRDRDDDQGARGGPRQSEAFLVKWTALTFNVKKVQTFLDGIVAEGGGDWEEAVKDGLECAMRQLKWRADAKKVIILVGSSPPHPQEENLDGERRSRCRPPDPSGGDLDLPPDRVLDRHARGGARAALDAARRGHVDRLAQRRAGPAAGARRPLGGGGGGAPAPALPGAARVRRRARRGVR